MKLTTILIVCASLAFAGCKKTNNPVNAERAEYEILNDKEVTGVLITEFKKGQGGRLANFNKFTIMQVEAWSNHDGKPALEWSYRLHPEYNGTHSQTLIDRTIKVFNLGRNGQGGSKDVPVKELYINKLGAIIPVKAPATTQPKVIKTATTSDYDVVINGCKKMIKMYTLQAELLKNEIKNFSLLISNDEKQKAQKLYEAYKATRITELEYVKDAIAEEEKDIMLWGQLKIIEEKAKAMIPSNDDLKNLSQLSKQLEEVLLQ